VTPGTRVAFVGDTDPDRLEGVVATPTDGEIAYAEQTYGGAVDGHVIVQWGVNDWDRSWERPEDLEEIG
jgi:hypothetical protein